MKLRFMITAVVAAVLGVWNVQAQMSADDVDAELAKPFPLVADEAMAQDDIDLETFDPTISYYVQNLNLTPEQIDKAQHISEAGQAKKEELLRQIEALRQEAYNLEASSLIAFEAILTDDQKAAFHELQSNVNGADNNIEASTEDNEKNNIKE